MIELAVFGAGRIGQVHALNAAAHPSARLKYIVDPVASEHREHLAIKPEPCCAIRKKSLPTQISQASS